MTIFRSRSIWTSIRFIGRCIRPTAGDPPRGNTVNRAPMNPEAENGKEPEILFAHLMEGIGLALDLKGGRMFITDFGGSVYSADLDGSNRRTLLFAEGNLTGIAYAEVPSADRGGASQVIGVSEETNMEDNTLVKSSFFSYDSRSH